MHAAAGPRHGGDAVVRREGGAKQVDCAENQADNSGPGIQEGGDAATDPERRSLRNHRHCPIHASDEAMTSFPFSRMIGPWATMSSSANSEVTAIGDHSRSCRLASRATAIRVG